jgi:hypothetical protein
MIFVAKRNSLHSPSHQLSAWAAHIGNIDEREKYFE